MTAQPPPLQPPNYLAVAYKGAKARAEDGDPWDLLAVVAAGFCALTDAGYVVLYMPKDDPGDRPTARRPVRLLGRKTVGRSRPSG